MKTVGFNFSKIAVEKFSDKLDKIKLKTNIEFKEIKSVKADMFKTKEDFLGVNFVYFIDYGSEFGRIDFTGNIVVSLDSKKSKAILKDWQNKKMSEEFRVYLLNIILRKCTVKALELEDEMNFPLHMKMPYVKPEETKKK